MGLKNTSNQSCFHVWTLEIFRTKCRSFGPDLNSRKNIFWYARALSDPLSFHLGTGWKISAESPDICVCYKTEDVSNISGHHCMNKSGSWQRLISQLAPSAWRVIVRSRSLTPIPEETSNKSRLSPKSDSEDAVCLGKPPLGPVLWQPFFGSSWEFLLCHTLPLQGFLLVILALQSDAAYLHLSWQISMPYWFLLQQSNFCWYIYKLFIQINKDVFQKQTSSFLNKHFSSCGYLNYSLQATTAPLAVRKQFRLTCFNIKHSKRSINLHLMNCCSF